jgi:hypothetical protein
MVGNHNKTKH